MDTCYQRDLRRKARELAVQGYAFITGPYPNNYVLGRWMGEATAILERLGRETDEGEK